MFHYLKHECLIYRIGLIGNLKCWSNEFTYKYTQKHPILYFFG